jgi:hypothetical protein
MIFSSRDRPASSSSRLRRIAQADPRATESPTCSVPFFSELGSGLRDRRAWAPRAFVGIVARRLSSHISSRNGHLYPVRSCARWRILAALRQQVMAPGRTKSGVSGTSKRPRNSDKVAPYEGRVGRRMASQARKKARRGAAPGRACLRSKAAIAAGQIEGKAVDQFHFLGKITAEIRGRATRTERELNVD